MIIGLAVKDHIDALLENAVVVAWALIIGGVAILIIERLAKPREVHGVANVTTGEAIKVGLMQCLAIIPGRQPFGSDDHGCDVTGNRPADRGGVQFLPRIADIDRGDSVADVQASQRNRQLTTLNLIAIGFVVSFVVALAVIKAFLAIVTRHGFAPFAWYRIVAGGGALVWLSIR